MTWWRTFPTHFVCMHPQEMRVRHAWVESCRSCRETRRLTASSFWVPATRVERIEDGHWRLYRKDGALMASRHIGV